MGYFPFHPNPRYHQAGLKTGLHTRDLSSVGALLVPPSLLLLYLHDKELVVRRLPASKVDVGDFLRPIDVRVKRVNSERSLTCCRSGRAFHYLTAVLASRRNTSRN